MIDPSKSPADALREVRERVREIHVDEMRRCEIPAGAMARSPTARLAEEVEHLAQIVAWLGPQAHWPPIRGEG